MGVGSDSRVGIIKRSTEAVYNRPKLAECASPILSRSNTWESIVGSVNLVVMPSTTLMSFYVYTAPDGLNYRHDTTSVTVFDTSLIQLSPAFDTADDCDCAVSQSANAFAIGYWSGVNLSLFDLRTGDPKKTFPFQRIGPLATFDRSGTHLLFQSGKKTVLLNSSTADAVDVKGVRALDRLIVRLAQNEAIIPSQKKDELLRISLESGLVTSMQLEFNATLFDLKLSPCGSCLMAIDRKKSIHCIDAENWSVVWTRSLKKELGAGHMGVGQFSGDGSLFGAAVSASGGNYTLVVDAESGDLVNNIPTICYGLPHIGSTVRNQSTRNGSFTAKTLDLSSGVEGAFTLDLKDG